MKNEEERDSRIDVGTLPSICLVSKHKASENFQRKYRKQEGESREVWIRLGFQLSRKKLIKVAHFSFRSDSSSRPD
jgi:hypothetical protein